MDHVYRGDGLTMPSEQAAYLRAICEAPADDNRRLAYADLLDAQGEHQRAQLIRLQIEKWVLEQTNDDTTVREVEIDLEVSRLLLATPPAARRSSAIWNELLWTAELRMIVENAAVPASAQPWDDFGWRRGFIGKWRCPSAAFIRCAPAVFAIAPIEEVRLTDCAPDVERDKKGGHRFVWCLDYGERVPTGRTDVSGVPPHRLPMALYQRLPNFAVATMRRAHVFATEEQAHHYLSQACVALGRESARLSALPRRAP